MMFVKKAPELTGLKEWVNSEKLSLKMLRGRIVLLDFWAYTCVNCLRAIPKLEALHRKYFDKGLVIIGIHTPEFTFEKDWRNVKAAVLRNGISYAVVNDPGRVNWHRYGNTYWPRSALIDGEGNLVMNHVGESGYDEIERKIIALKGLDMPVIEESKREYLRGITPETYAGSLRSAGFGSGKICTKDGCDEYLDSGVHDKGVLYPGGDWRQNPEFVEFVGDAGSISLSFRAREVNVVLSGDGVAEVHLGGKPLGKACAGRDISFVGGKSVVKVRRADMYNLVDCLESGEGDLKIIPFRGLRVYAYTFG